jgi:hypothetical protein
MEFRRKRPVMMAMDLTRFAALMSVPAAFALGWLSFAQLLVVSVITGAAKIAFSAASGAYLKTIVRPEDLLVANGRFESKAGRAVRAAPGHAHRGNAARVLAHRAGVRTPRPGRAAGQHHQPAHRDRDRRSPPPGHPAPAPPA